MFALIDLVNRQLAYFDLPVALVLTAIVYPTMVLLSGGLHRLYRRHFAATMLRPATLAAMVALSFAGAGVMVAVLAGRVPQRGEVVPYADAGFDIEVLDADPRRIKRLRLHRRLPAPDIMSADD